MSETELIRIRTLELALSLKAMDAKTDVLAQARAFLAYVEGSAAPKAAKARL